MDRKKKTARISQSQNIVTDFRFASLKTVIFGSVFAEPHRIFSENFLFSEILLMRLKRQSRQGGIRVGGGRKKWGDRNAKF